MTKHKTLATLHTCGLSTEAAPQQITVHFLFVDEFSDWKNASNSFLRAWIESQAFEGKPCSFLTVPAVSGQLDSIILILPRPRETQTAEAFAYCGYLATQLTTAQYILTGPSLTPLTYQAAAIAWGRGYYQFSRYKTAPLPLKPNLYLPSAAEPHTVLSVLQSIYLVRDLINTPSQDMGPEELTNVALSLAKEHHMQAQVFSNDALKTKNFPAVYAVGKGSTRPPAVVSLTYGEKKQPHLILIGKGVCFDSGGYDLKPSKAMRLMKKDMGGAAHVLGLAHLILSKKLPVRLTILIAAVENLVSGNAFKPGDVINTRLGKTVEVGNTDAEGRLLLADLLSYASELSPDLIIDFATLTGAARVALGAEVPVFFSNQETLAQALMQAATQTADPLWQLPLYQPYHRFLNSSIADLSNDSASPYGGAITAALFLENFIAPNIPWCHIDLMAWNLSTQAGKPEGGEAMGLLAIFQYLQKRYLQFEQTQV